MVGGIRSIVRRMLDKYSWWLCKKEFQEQKFKRHNERPVEFAFLLGKIATLYPRTILDVGTGTTALPHLMRNCGCLVTAIDNVTDYWPSGMTNRHYHVIDDDITDTGLSERFDLISCISVLEHIEDSASAVENMFRLLAPGGHIVITCPYNEAQYIRNVYELPGSSYGQNAPYITQAFCRADVDGWLESSGGEIVDQEYWRYWDGEFWTIGKQVLPPQVVDRHGQHQLTCLLLKKS